MKNNTCKILVLTDLKDHSNDTLYYAASLSKAIGADMELFHAKSAIEIVETDSPLTAMRTINDVCNKTKKRMKKLITPISKEKDIDIKMTYGYGNVKSEIEYRIRTLQPDVIVLGHRKRKLFSFVGDNIIDFVKRKYDGIVITADDTADVNFDITKLMPYKSQEELIV